MSAACAPTSATARDMPAVLPPERRLAGFDHAPGWQAIFADLPPLQLAPVLPRPQGRDERGREFGDRFPAQDPNGDASRRGARSVGLVEPATDNPVAELTLKDTVDGRVRHRVKPLEHVVLVVTHA